MKILVSLLLYHINDIRSPKIINYSCVNNYRNFTVKNTLRNVIKSFNPQHIKQSKSLSLSLSLKEVKIDHFIQEAFEIMSCVSR